MPQQCACAGWLHQHPPHGPAHLRPHSIAIRVHQQVWVTQRCAIQYPHKLGQYTQLMGRLCLTLCEKMLRIFQTIPEQQQPTWSTNSSSERLAGRRSTRCCSCTAETGWRQQAEFFSVCLSSRARCHVVEPIVRTPTLDGCPTAVVYACRIAL
jgi:hypothetical protein